MKPDNILLLHGHAKVADFGLAKLQDASQATGTFCGTPAYMAPEIWGNNSCAASDPCAGVENYLNDPPPP